MICRKYWEESFSHLLMKQMSRYIYIYAALKLRLLSHSITFAEKKDAALVLSVSLSFSSLIGWEFL